MKKKHLQNMLSIEKRSYDSNIKKFKRLIDMKCSKVKEIKLEPVGNIAGAVLDEESSTCAGSSGRDEVEEEDTFESSLEETQEINGTVLSRITYSTPDNDEASTSTAKIHTANTPLTTSKNEGIQKILLKILGRLDGIKAIKNRLEKIEKHQTIILNNQGILSSGHSSIVTNQLQIAHKLEEIEASIQIKSETTDEDSFCRMIGETIDRNFDELASMLPMTTVEAVNELETKLDSEEFSQAMKRYLYKMKGVSDDVSTIVRALFTDDLLANFNWDGSWNKQALGKLKLFNVILADVFQNQGAFHFEKNVRKAVEKSHHRSKQKKYSKKHRLH